MASTARAFVLSFVTDLSPPQQQPAQLSRHHFLLHHSSSSSSSNLVLRHSSYHSAIVSCLSSGGGVSDEFVSTRKSTFDKGFTVIANMLRRIKPLDNSVISKGVSDSAKDSMKQTISTMLGLLPSEHFDVTISFSKQSLKHLLFSAIITGYTLWSAEYRIGLVRNFNMSAGVADLVREDHEEVLLREESEGEGEGEGGGGELVASQDFSEMNSQVLRDLSPEALNHIQQLQSELHNANEELNARKRETGRIECDRGSRNDLLEYLRSLDSNMVAELSRPSSVEVEDIIDQLVQNILRRFFRDDPALNFLGDSVVHDGSDEFSDNIGTSRDYLAKLLFWCMLLGHHLRGLENRLHLSCVVGLL